MTERVEAEVVVAGGGPGGICAALAAARLGKKTVLATDRPVLGGNSSSEIRVWTRGATGAGNLYGEEMGIWGELKLRNLYLNQEGNPVFWDDVLLEQVLSEPNLKLYLNTHISGMETDGQGRIAWVSGFQMMTEKELRFEGAYYIDATGDGSLGAMAGLPYRMGKESRDTYGESFAPVEEERTTFGSTLFFFTKREDHPVSYIAPDYAYPRETIEELLGKGGRIANEKMDGCDYWWFETGGMADTIREAQEIGLELKRFTAGVWDYIKNSGRYDADCLTLSWEGNMPGKRESRRFITKKILTQQDILEHRAFEDGAFYGGWYLDFHPSHGFKTEEDNCTQIPVQVYAVPLGCLYPTCDSNLLFAGRDIGVSHVAFASTRIMNTCALSGQAAGTLAARCIELGKRPGDLAAEEIQGVQQTLLRNDMMIPGIRHSEEGDLAREAIVSSSGAECRGAFGETGTFSLSDGGILVFPRRAAGTEFLVESGQTTEVSYQCYRSDVPSRLALGSRLGTMKTVIPEGKSWISFPIPEGVADGFITLEFSGNQSVSVVTGEEQLTGFLLGREDSPQYCYPCLKLPDDCGLYGESNVVNGYNRPWREPGSWISGPAFGEGGEFPWIRLDFQEPRTVREILVFFNPDLSRELNSSRASMWDDHHKFLPRTGMPPELVKSAVIYGILPDGSRREIAVLEDNWNRIWRALPQDGITVTGLTLEIRGTYGARRAEVFEICVY
ncbi:MAG: FAD-dependent oxidoreductase [Enterocloster asparagiformis]|nr:FAD-dependent oxidoreductase [Enterocloster asparagiformis]